MSFSELIRRSRAYLARFDYDDYPLCFAEFEAAAAPLFDALAEDDLTRAAEALLRELDGARAALPRRERRAALDADRQVLALFLSPAALRRGESAAAFAGELCRLWRQEQPRAPYYCGEYEAIMKGFEANLMGLPLRKSRRR